MRPAVLALLLFAALAGCNGGSGSVGAPPVTVPAGGAALVLLPAGAPSAGHGIPEARVEVASDPEARARGLMGRSFLRPDEGMLFVYPADGERHFWMKDCSFPLSTAFMDASGRILNIEEMSPGAGLPDAELRTWDSAGPARYVLEMDGGWFHQRGIGPGDRVDLGPALAGVVAR